MADARRRYWLGVALVTGAAVAWSTAGAFTRLISLDTATLLVWRGVFGALGLVAFGLLVEGPTSLARFRKLGSAGTVFAGVSAAGMIFFLLSLRQTTVAHVAVIYATVPFVAAGMAWLVLRERPSRSALAGSAVALGAVAVLVGADGQGHLAGDMLALAMTACMAGMMVIARRAPAMPTLQAATLSAFVSALAAVPLAQPVAPQGLQWVQLAAFGLVNSALGLALFSWGAKRLPPVETALIGALDAPLAPVWVWLFFAETPSRTSLWCGAVVAAAVAAHLVRTGLSQRARPAPG